MSTQTSNPVASHDDHVHYIIILCDCCLNDPKCASAHASAQELKDKCEEEVKARAQGQVRGIDWSLWLPLILDVVRTILDKYAPQTYGAAKAQP